MTVAGSGSRRVAATAALGGPGCPSRSPAWSAPRSARRIPTRRPCRTRRTRSARHARRDEPTGPAGGSSVLVTRRRPRRSPCRPGRPAATGGGPQCGAIVGWQQPPTPPKPARWAPWQSPASAPDRLSGKEYGHAPACGAPPASRAAIARCPGCGSATPPSAGPTAPGSAFAPRGRSSPAGGYRAASRQRPADLARAATPRRPPGGRAAVPGPGSGRTPG